MGRRELRHGIGKQEMIKSHTFAGKRYRVRNLAGVPHDALGLCDESKRRVNIPINGDTLDEMDVILHESLHCCMPYLCEDAVNDSATSIARLLWRLGWRREIR
jgi:hypothetical protein